MKKLMTLVLLCTFYIGMSQNPVTHGKVTYDVSLEPLLALEKKRANNPMANPYLQKFSKTRKRKKFVVFP